MAKALLAWHLVFLMAVIALAPRVEASFAPSATTTAFRNRDGDIKSIEALLERKEVKARLLGLGFTPGEVGSRLSALDDREVHDLATRAENPRIGGRAEGVILGVLIIALVIFVILPLLGVRVWR